jgi:glycosyltransferase involved in cell wall biosynthesis
MLGIFDSHPVQYRAPVYRELQFLVPGAFHVFYATDVSLRGNRDKGFGQQIAWDESLLTGYPNTVLNCECGEPLRGFRSLNGHGVSDIFRSRTFSAVLQTQHLYAYDFEVLWQARRRGLPVWIRQETQDQAFDRAPFRGFLRSIAYTMLYTQVSHAFPIGKLNREHLLTHGIPESRMTAAPYCTADRFGEMTESAQTTMRSACRKELGIAESAIVIGFFGKLIPKKDPGLILKALSMTPEARLQNLAVLFVGSGELEEDLRRQSAILGKAGVPVHFAGFMNQSQIASYYAATDIMVLPSRRMGETWGLVVNEALQAGCSVAVSDAAGCAVEFGHLPHVAVFPAGDAMALSERIRQLIKNPPHDRNWARSVMNRYSCREAAAGIARLLNK